MKEQQECWLKNLKTSNHYLKERCTPAFFSKKTIPKNLKDSKKLKLLISKNEEYQIYKIFVGWEYITSDKLSWSSAEKERNQEIENHFFDTQMENIQMKKQIEQLKQELQQK